jgi:hypothetical protein
VRNFQAISAALAAALLCGCGYTGDPLPPALMIPETVDDLRGCQRGGEIVLEFTPPRKTTEGILLKSPPAIELRGGPNLEGPFDIQAWLAGSRLLPPPQIENGVARLRVPAAEWIGKEAVFAVRTAGPKGKSSAWSNLIVLRVVAPPEPPSRLRAEATATGVLLEWEGAGTRWRVFRRQGKESVQAAEVEERRWLDREAQFGQSYEYTVQQVVLTGAVPAVSEPSGPARIEYRDTFPPASPAGLRAVAGPGGVELSWDRNTEPDFRAYQVWRAQAGGALLRLGEPSPSSSFTDRTAVSGTRYRYAVSAIDVNGNESRPCEAVEIVAP